MDKKAVSELHCGRTYVWTQRDDKLLLGMFTMGLKNGTDPVFIAEAFSDAVGIQRSLSVCVARFSYLNSTAIAAWAGATARTRSANSSDASKPTCHEPINDLRHKEEARLCPKVSRKGGTSSARQDSIIGKEGSLLEKSPAEKDEAHSNQHWILPNCSSRRSWRTSNDNHLKQCCEVQNSNSICWDDVQSVLRKLSKERRSSEEIQHQDLSMGIVGDASQSLCKPARKREVLSTSVANHSEQLSRASDDSPFEACEFHSGQVHGPDFRASQTLTQRKHGCRVLHWTRGEETLLLKAREEIRKPSGICDWIRVAAFMNRNSRHQRSVAAYQQRCRAITERQGLQ